MGIQKTKTNKRVKIHQKLKNLESFKNLVTQLYSIIKHLFQSIKKNHGSGKK